MKILIDARSLMSSPRGVGQFLLNALEALRLARPEWQFILVANKPLHPEVELRIQEMSNIRVDIDTKISRSIIWFLLCFNRLAKKHQVDLAWFPATEIVPFKLKEYKTLVTVHDVVCKEFRNTMSFKNKIVTTLLFSCSIQSADMLWAVSNYTKVMIERYFPKRKSMNIVVGSSINTALFKKVNITVCRVEEIKKSYQISKDSKILLFVGTLEPRKNLKYLLSLMPDLANKGFELIIVGGKGWGDTNIVDIVKAEGFPKDKVHFAGYITDFELLELYNVCDCYVSTSLNEGFGMPQLEALFCETPVVTANNSAMNEVVSGAGVIVNGWDPHDWVNAIVGAVELRCIKGYELKKNEYSWGRIAEQIASYIEQNREDV